MAFKKDFAWGVATASYQIEGAYNEDGRGLSIWDVYTREDGRIFNNDNGDIACDHYHRFREDIKIMKEIGVKAYRFSISWSRIIPDGVGKLNEKGVKFYSDLIDELLKNGIEPYITLYHWDYPYELHKKGGWLNPESIEWFTEYAKKVIELYSDRVKYFITFNEPQAFIGQGYVTGMHAPGTVYKPKEVFQICHNVLKSHGSAVKAMRKAALSDIKIGYAPTGVAHFPLTDTPEDIEATRKAFFTCEGLSNYMQSVSWWSDPVILGKYPEDGLRIFKYYLPEITEEDMRLISQPIDFYGQNIYQGRPVKKGENSDFEITPLPQGYTKTAAQWPVTPQSLYWAPKFLYERYKLPIFITENGMSAHDVISLDGKVHDPNRIDFFERYLAELEKATDDGVDVEGYFIWTLMDDFEWATGYTDRFGLVYVDFATQERTLKDSAYWYKEWIKNH